MEPSHKFQRVFAHVEGNWPSSVLVPVALSKDLLALSYAAVHHASSCMRDGSVWVSSEGLHMSLSKPFALRLHQIDPFVQALTKRLEGARAFVVRLYAQYTILCNETNQRSFLALFIDDAAGLLTRLVSSVDEVMAKFGKPLYHENPIHHISIASVALPLEEAIVYAPGRGAAENGYKTGDVVDLSIEHSAAIVIPSSKTLLEMVGSMHVEDQLPSDHDRNLAGSAVKRKELSDESCRCSKRTKGTVATTVATVESLAEQAQDNAGVHEGQVQQAAAHRTPSVSEPHQTALRIIRGLRHAAENQGDGNSGEDSASEEDEPDDNVTVSDLVADVFGFPSYGNAGQFACDALCVTLQSEMVGDAEGSCCVGALEHPALLPMAAFDVWPSGKKRCFPAEVHWFASKQLLVVLVRTQYITSMKQQFMHDLMVWLHSVSSPGAVMLALCSVSLEGQDDEVISGNRFFFAASSIDEVKQRLHPKLAGHLAAFYDLTCQTKETSPYRGGEITAAFLEECGSLNVPGLVFGRFCTEGDNTGDGVQLAGVLMTSWLTPDVQQLRIKAPASWQLGFGPDAL